MQTKIAIGGNITPQYNRRFHSTNSSVVISSVSKAVQNWKKNFCFVLLCLHCWWWQLYFCCRNVQFKNCCVIIFLTLNTLWHASTCHNQLFLTCRQVRLYIYNLPHKKNYHAASSFNCWIMKNIFIKNIQDNDRNGSALLLPDIQDNMKFYDNNW